MTDRGRRSLLDFAVGASIAVVPIMLGIVLLVAALRPREAGTAPWRGGAADSHVSVRHVAALKTFEGAIVERTATTSPAPAAQQVLDGVPQCRREWSAGWHAGAALARWAGVGAGPPSPAAHIAAQLAALDGALQRFGARPNPRVGAAVGFDAARWFALARRSLDDEIESPAYPGRRFRLRCADLAAALAALLHADARMLDALAWRGSEGSTVLARWRPGQMTEISAHHVARRNPWRGVAGCIYLGRQPDGGDAFAPSHFVAGVRSVQRRSCGTQAVAAAGIAASAAAVAAAGRGATLRRADTLIALAGEPGLADPPDDTRWMVPPSLHAMLQPLESLRQPSGALYRAYAETVTARDGDAADAGPSPQRVMLDGAAVDTGFSIALTIEPALQSLAQRTAACYTGRHDVCRALGLRRHDDHDRPIGHDLLEGAMVRMAAVAVVDVASGRIEALAGALSRCARQEVDGPGRDAACDARLPYPVQYRPDALLNPAVFHDAMPASTVKPVMAAAFLADPLVGPRWLAAERAAMRAAAAPARDSLRGQLLRSDSARFLDRMFCLDQGASRCDRPWAVQAAAAALGWNAGCGDAGAAAASRDCGKHDLLFGRPVDTAVAAATARPPSLPVAYGRLLSQPHGGQLGTAMRLMPRTVLDPALVRRCAAGADGRRASDDDWEKCRGGAMVDVVAEGWGQGHARASALGVAGMLAALAAAANGQTTVRRPHLVESLHGAGGLPPPALAAALLQWQQPALQPRRVASEAAAVVLDGLSYSHRIGTARSACEQVFDARRCRDIDWLAGKTGTPSFPHDGIALDELARRCPGGAAAPQAGPAPCSALRPYKWYVAAYRADGSGSGPWTKVIAVLTERNWNRRTGQVHGAGDHGPNPAAEIALQITGHQLGLLNRGAP